MASWIDVFSLVMTTLFFFGSIVGVFYAVQRISSRFQAMKTSLENQGIAVSREGVSLKTLKRFDRETYVDTTQRGLVKMLGAATVGPETHKQAFLINGKGNATSGCAGDEHEKLAFGLRRSQSDKHDEEHK